MDKDRLLSIFEEVLGQYGMAKQDTISSFSLNYDQQMEDLNNKMRQYHKDFVNILGE